MLFVVLLNIIYQSFSVGSNVWVGVWADDNDTLINGTVNTAKRDMYLAVYGVLGIGQAFSTMLSNLLFAKGTIDAAVKIHRQLLHNVMRLPCAFFDITPVGRILGRFSQDINGVDMRLPNAFQMLLSTLVRVTGTIFVISFTTPLFIAVIVPVGIVYIGIQRIYVATSRQLMRLTSVTASPIYSHFGETLSGAQTIRAYKKQDDFIEDSERKVDVNQSCQYPTIISSRWLAVRLETIGNLIIFFAALFSVLEREAEPALVGLSVSYALQITQTLNWLVRMTSDAETSIVAMERIKEYVEIEQEAQWEIASKNPPADWPQNGVVDFKKYSVRYRPGLELVLKDLTVHIEGGEKVGIVGRTGAGKSSLTLALFRIIEAAEGHIFIDGVDISELGLHTLRSRLTIIPQDPVLLSGSLRVNLDPFQKHTDEELWDALENCHLKQFVQNQQAGLHFEVTEGGDNLSVGQRQLICLGRALLRRTKVLILDEATAAVDLETDDLIQRTIRIAFNNCTILTIAHRLNTIIDSDKILVLDKGCIAEYDTPQSLLQDQNTIFYGMCKDAGLV
nr:unnamed protein product [Callosobruchus chinensis]